MGNQRLREIGGSVRRDRNLEPILAGIARTADPQRLTQRVERAALHEAELADSGNDRFEHFGGSRTLKREQRLLLHMIDDDLARQPPLKLLDIAMLGRAVDDDIEIVAAARRHQIVDDPAILVEQQRIFELHVGERLKVGREAASPEPYRRRGRGSAAGPCG